MHTKRVGFSGRRDIAANGGHYLLHTVDGVIGAILAGPMVKATGGRMRFTKRKARHKRRAF
jgi:hypothetical protein